MTTELGIPGSDTPTWLFNEGTDSEVVIYADTMAVAIAIWHQNGIVDNMLSIRNSKS